MTRHIPLVVLVGRPNVGKSTLFNRITETRRAIVTPVPGTTRDFIAQPVVWQGVTFELGDTGGMFGATADPLHALVVQQGRHALERADLVVMVVDGREGLVPGDHDIAVELRRLGRPVILAINKMDDKRAKAGAMEFYQLGFDPIFEISAEHGQATGDLLEEIIRRLRGRKGAQVAPELAPADAPAPGSETAAEVGVAVIGRPNVGKSSLVNRLLREERVMVSDQPGTTRDAVDAVVSWHRRQFRIVDTAGIRKPGRVSRSGQVESLSVLIAKRSIEEADVVAMVIDASVGVTDQDAAIAGAADHAGRGIIIVANKWDLMKDRGPDFVKQFDEDLRYKLKFLDYAPILHISALSGERAGKVLETIDRVADARKRRVPTPALNKFVEAVTAVHPPASPGRRHVRILYAAQIGIAPPTFVFFTNVATTFHFSYERFLTNQLRESFGFIGSPIRIQVRRRSESKHKTA